MAEREKRIEGGGIMENETTEKLQLFGYAGMCFRRQGADLQANFLPGLLLAVDTPTARDQAKISFLRIFPLDEGFEGHRVDVVKAPSDFLLELQRQVEISGKITADL